MSNIGYSDLKNVIRLPANVDQSYLAKWRLKDGTTFDRVIARIGAALVLFNRGLTTGYWGQYFRTTTDITVEYPTGNSGRLGEVAEYSRPDPIFGASTGHMLPMKDYGGALGWTYLALRRAHAGKIDLDIRALIEKAGDLWEWALLTRLFKSAAETVGSGKSVGLADGGVADAEYIPPSYEGRTFLNTHTHYGRQTDDANGRLAAVKAMAAHLLEHGIASPWDLVIPEVDKTDWAGVDGFKKPERGILSTAGVEVRAAVPEETYIGIIEVNDGWFRVKPTPRLPTDYAGAFKPLGFGNTTNPLIVRYEDGYPLGLTLVGQIEEYPLQDAVALFTFGVGVANRLNGVCYKFASSGDYTDPTIS